MKCPDSIVRIEGFRFFPGDGYFPDDACFVITTEMELQSTVGSALYGLYTVLYVLCMYIFFTRKQHRHWAHCALNTAIYVVATILFGLKYTMYSTKSQAALLQYTALKEQRLPSPDSAHELSLLTWPLTQMEYAAAILIFVSNGVTDVLMVSKGSDSYLAHDFS
ncbi:hypothetical protein PQX77_014320 [Marasmius sp. AFHP31]|nr:hypothetical protein PQX77_014320 [Marasmius sp. AFHP31]